MEFLWCIPVLPLAPSLSYYFYQEAETIRETREHTRYLVTLFRPMSEAFVNILNRSTRKYSDSEPESQFEPESESESESESEPDPEPESESEPKPTDHVSIPIPDDPVWDNNYNKVSWEPENSDSDTVSVRSDRWAWNSWTSIKAKND